MRIRSADIVDSCQLMIGVTGPPDSILNLHGGRTASSPSTTPEERDKKNSDFLWVRLERSSTANNSKS